MSTSSEFESFFRLSDPLANRPLRLEPAEAVNSMISKSMANRLFRGEVEPEALSFTLQLEGYMGRQLTDFLWSGLTPLRCISDRVIELLRAHEFKGWSTFPTMVLARDHRPVTGYHGLAVVGRAGAYRPELSEPFMKPPPVPGGEEWLYYRGLYFDLNTWDSSDFFLLGDSNWCIVTARVAQAFKRDKVSNVRLTRLTEVEVNSSVLR